MQSQSVFQAETQAKMFSIESPPSQCLESMVKMFRVGSDGDDPPVNFKEISCSKSIKEAIRKSEGEACGPDDNPGEMVHIGWQDDEVFHLQESDTTVECSENGEI